MEGEVGDLGAQEGAGPAHDRAQHRVEVAQPGQVVCGGVERGQFGLAAPAALQLGAYPQREELGPLQCGEPAGGGALGAGAQHRPLVLLRGGARGQQPEEGVLGRVVGGGALRSWVPSRPGAGAPAGTASRSYGAGVGRGASTGSGSGSGVG